MRTPDSGQSPATRRTFSLQCGIGLGVFGVITSCSAIIACPAGTIVVALLLISLPVVHGQLLKDVVHGPFGLNR